jgi:hypothetical protein
MHAVPLQHPGQLRGPHPGSVWQLPFRHAWPGAHDWHAAPLLPHSAFSVVSTQRPLVSQHPAQLSGLHVPAEPRHCPPPPFTAPQV